MGQHRQELQGSRPFTPEEKARAVAMRRAGRTLAQIGEDLGRSPCGALQRVLRAAGVRAKADRLPEMEAELRRLHAQRKTVPEIALELGVCPQTVGNWLARLELPDPCPADPERERRILAMKALAKAGRPLFDPRQRGGPVRAQRTRRQTGCRVLLAREEAG